MTVQKLLSLCWSYEWVSVEGLNGEPVCEMEEAIGLCERHPEIASMRVHTFFIGIRFVDCLHKSVSVLVVEVD